jgi:hypothetical protein
MHLRFLQHIEKGWLDIKKVLNTVFTAMCEYNEKDIDQYKYEYQNKWLRKEYPVSGCM